MKLFVTGARTVDDDFEDHFGSLGECCTEEL